MGSQATPTNAGLIPPGRPANAQSGHNAAMGPEATKGIPTTNAAPKKTKPRSSSLARAARERRQQTVYNNYVHPPSPEEFWLCEFCEYEKIFGQPPVALIRQYEIKDRRRREEDANRKRLLDKAKSKSRKGKKASKSSAKHSGAGSNRAAAAPPPPPEEEDAHGDQGGAYLDRDDDHYQDNVEPRPEYYADNVRGDGYSFEQANEWDPPPRPGSRPST